MSVIYEFEKYVATPATLRATLEKYGVVIIPSVLTDAECDKMVTGMWDTLEHLTKNFDTPIDRDDDSTWRSFYELLPLHSMLIQHWGIGHAQYIWNLRSHPAILKIWKTFWGVESARELLVSTDAVSYHLPPETTNKGWYRGASTKNGKQAGSWFHTDQSYTRNDFECVQSWVTAYDVNDGDASLAILEGSHSKREKFLKRFPNQNKSNWYKLEPEELDFYIRDLRCLRRSIRCPKGSIVFWDSRTIHCGQEPVKTRARPNFRSIVYLCYTPRVLATEKDLIKKRKYFEEQRLTSHWPHIIKVFGKYPRTYGNPLPTITPLPKPRLNAIGKYLVGYGDPDTELEYDEEGFAIV